MPLPTTTLSTKGQVILPKAVRDSRNWKPGIKLVVEERPEGILLRPVRENPFPPTTIQEVLAMVDYKGPVITLEDMDEAVAEAVAEDWEKFERG